MSVLTRKIRAKYPGAYKDMDDATLEQKVLAKYPMYKDLAVPAPEEVAQEALTPEPTPTFSGMFKPGGERNQGPKDDFREYPHITTFGPSIGSNAQIGEGAQEERIREAKMSTGAAISSIPGPMLVELPLQFAGGALMASAEDEDPLVGGAVDVGANLLLRGAGKVVGKYLDARAAKKAASTMEEAAAEAGVPEVLREGGEAVTHEAGRPATRKRLVEALAEAGYREGDLQGKSANQLKALLLEQGGDPKMAGRAAPVPRDVGTTTDVIEAGEMSAAAPEAPRPDFTPEAYETELYGPRPRAERPATQRMSGGKLHREDVSVEDVQDALLNTEEGRELIEFEAGLIRQSRDVRPAAALEEAQERLLASGRMPATAEKLFGRSAGQDRDAVRALYRMGTNQPSGAAAGDVPEVDRSLTKMGDNVSDMEAIVAAEKAGGSDPAKLSPLKTHPRVQSIMEEISGIDQSIAGKGEAPSRPLSTVEEEVVEAVDPKAARGGPSREVQALIDLDEGKRTQAAASVDAPTQADDTLFEERFGQEASRDIPTEGIEAEPIRTEVRPGEIVEQRPRDAWHPQHGQVRVDVVKGDKVLATDLRGRPRVLSKQDLKFIEPEEIRRGAGSIADQDKDMDDILFEMGIEPETRAPSPTMNAETMRARGYEFDPTQGRHGAWVHPETGRRQTMGMGMGQAPAGKGTAQHRSFRKKGPKPPKPETPPSPKGPGAPEFSPELKAKVRTAVKGQRMGRLTADERNIKLHAKQARVMRKWQDAAQAGELPHGDAQIKAMEEMHRVGAGIEDVGGAQFSTEELKALHDYNLSQNWGDSFEKFRMANVLEGMQSGRQLQQHELRALKKLLGPAFVPSGARDWTLWQWMKRLPMIASGTMKSLRASFDISAPLRQAKQLTLGHPAIAARAFGAQLKALVSEGRYASMMDVIKDNPLRDLQVASGLHLSDLSEVAQAGMSGAEAEEMFAHSAGQLIPGIGRAVRGSERAFVMYLNKMRSDVFNKMAYSYMRSGITPETDPRVFKKLAEAVNLMAGRGELGKVGEKAMPLLQTLFFAPRFMASRFQLLRDLPRLYMNYPAPVRKLLLKNVMLDIGATSAALYGAAQLTGADLETDPTSSDYMKLRIGEVRLDPWAGFQPWVRLFAQLAMGERKSPVTGETTDLKGFGSDRLTSIYHFLEQKASPVAGIARDALRGQSPVGEDIEFFQDQFPYLGKDTLQQVVPFIFQDVKEVLDRADAELLLLTVPFSAVGGGVQAFPAPDTKKQGAY